MDGAVGNSKLMRTTKVGVDKNDREKKKKKGKRKAGDYK